VINKLVTVATNQRDTIARLREEASTLRSETGDLQLRLEEEVYSGASWKKDRERLETKIGDLQQAYETATAAQGEQSNQIVALHSQVRELRGVLHEAEAEREILQKARHALQSELESIKFDHVDSTKLSSAAEMQKLQLKKQDLERSLEEQEDRVVLANERMKKAESYAAETQLELSKARVENSELDKLNVGAGALMHLSVLNNGAPFYLGQS
jgi:myosin protein heavy chain